MRKSGANSPPQYCTPAKAYDFLTDGFMLVPPQEWAESVGGEVNRQAWIESQPSYRYAGHNSIVSQLSRLGDRLSLDEQVNYGLTGVTSAGHTLEVFQNRGFTRIEMDYQAAQAFVDYGIDLRNEITFELDLGFGKGPIDRDEAIFLCGDIVSMAQAMRSLIHHVGVNQDDIDLMNSPESNSRITLGSAHYEPKAHVSDGNGGRLRKHRKYHRDANVKNGVAGSLQLSGEPTGWLGGKDRIRAHRFTQHCGEQVLLNNFEEGTGTTQPLHGPRVGENPRTCFLWIVRGDLARTLMAREHGVRVPLPDISRAAITANF